MKLKAKQPQKETSAEVSLADQLKEQLTEACAAAEGYIAKAAQREKAASPLQPLPWHELNLRLMHGRCACKCALALMAKEAGNGQ
jgi:hypothetical protein